MTAKAKNYRIFRVEKTTKRLTPKRITMMRIYAKDDKDAYDQLKDYIKIANKQYTYYVEPWSPYIVIRNGKKYTYEDCFEAWEDERNDEPLHKRIFDYISIYSWRYFVQVPKDIYYWCRDFIYLNRHKQQYCASWSIDKVLLETLKFNIPILKKYKHCFSWRMLEKAYLEKHPEISPSDTKKYFETHYNGYGDDVEKRSVELEYEMFDKLIDDINAYEYYMGGYEEIGWFGDANPEDMKKTDKKLRNTLPLIKGSYDRYDYKKLNALAMKRWNSIWETVRMYGQEFND